MLSKKTTKLLKEMSPKRIFLQIPEGLKAHAIDISKKIGHDADVFISCDPCYGACDVRVDEAKRLGCDVILHIGHSDFGITSDIPIIYDEYPIYVDAVKMLKNIDKITCKKISLITTVQHIAMLKKIKSFLEKNGKKVVIGQGNGMLPGQILGCRPDAAVSVDNDVECHLFIGSGNFHPLGLLKKTKSAVFSLDIETGKIADLTPERDKNRIKRMLRIEKAKKCKVFGILVSTKPGQVNMKIIENVKKELENKKKEWYILTMDEIKPEKIMGIDVDCLVNCSCPRLSEDSEMFGAMILSPDEIKYI